MACQFDAVQFPIPLRNGAGRRAASFEHTPYLVGIADVFCLLNTTIEWFGVISVGQLGSFAYLHTLYIEFSFQTEVLKIVT